MLEKYLRRDKINVAVLFDGAGLSRLGLERAGLNCVGIELNPIAHHLSQFVGSGQSVLGDVRDFDYSQFDAVWASPPCQLRSSARTEGAPVGDFAEDLLAWSLAIDAPVLWVENVKSLKRENNKWGTLYNAAQFLEEPIQNRQRVIGGRYPEPHVFREFKPYYKEFKICPCITASEFKGCASDTRRASRFYGRRLTMEECAYHMGFTIPEEWYEPPEFWDETKIQWGYEIYRAIGNGVPVFMAESFGKALVDSVSGSQKE